MGLGYASKIGLENNRVITETFITGFVQNIRLLIFIVCIVGSHTLWYRYIRHNCFLAHLSRRLIGELIVYPYPAYVRRRRLSSVHNFKELLRNRSAIQCQILCGVSLGRANEILFALSGSHTKLGTP